MDDSKLVKLFLTKKLKNVTNKQREQKEIEICPEIIDNFDGYDGNQHILYLKWVYLAFKHKNGDIVLEGKLKTAKGFIDFASQFDERYIPVNILTTFASKVFSEKTVSFIPVKVYTAIVSGNSSNREYRLDIINEYEMWDGQWELSPEELKGLSFIKTLI